MSSAKQLSTVGEGGRVEVVVEGFRSGETVEVSVERVNVESTKSVVSARPGERPLGFLDGKIQISDDFDAPLDDFRDYS